MCTEEFYFSFTLLCSFGTKSIFAVLLQRNESTVAARNGAVKTIPKFVEFTFCRSQSFPYLHIVVACVASSPTTFQTVV